MGWGCVVLLLGQGLDLVHSKTIHTAPPLVPHSVRPATAHHTTPHRGALGALEGWMPGTPLIGALVAGGSGPGVDPAERVDQGPFPAAHEMYLAEHHARSGGCPAVFTPSQLTHHRHS